MQSTCHKFKISLCDTDFDHYAGILFIHAFPFRNCGIRVCTCAKAVLHSGEHIKLKDVSRILSDSEGPYPIPFCKHLLELLPSHKVYRRQRLEDRLQNYRELPLTASKILLQIFTLDEQARSRTDIDITSANGIDSNEKKSPCLQLNIYTSSKSYCHMYNWEFGGTILKTT